MDSASGQSPSKKQWMTSLAAITAYQWTVFVVCYAGGLFDGLDSSLFTAVQPVAIKSLLVNADPTEITRISAWVAALFLLGWTTGGMVFGALADRIGRVRALTLSILIYALFTGLCGLAQTWWQLAIFRYLTALGIGGELIVGTTLLAESWPEGARARIVGILATAYQGGVSMVGVANMLIGQFSWRYLFLLGTLPALITMLIRRRVHEPERWQTMAAERASGQHNAGSGFMQIFEGPYRRNALVGSAFTGALLIAYWASSFWIPAWIGQLLPGSKPTHEIGLMLLLQGLFAIGGSTLAGFCADAIGRRPTVALASGGYVLASLCLFGLNPVFTNMVYVWGSFLGIFIGMNIGICYITVPELFPTRLRATGTGFCFNLGRIAAAVGVLTSSELIRLFGGSYAMAAGTVSLVLIPAMAIVFLAPETRGRPLEH